MDARVLLCVHELRLSAGHSNAMVEVINHLSPGIIDKLYCLCYEHDSIDELFPGRDFDVEVLKVPCCWISPFLFKMWWFHIFVRFYLLLRIPKKTLKISIGTASLSSDIVNLQFIQSQWADFFFRFRKFNPISFLYKKFLFFCFSYEEKRVFSSVPEVTVLATFMGDYLKNTFSYPSEKIHLIRSSVNWQRFSIVEDTKSLESSLMLEYPDLCELDFNKPIGLFVGAFERKGLQETLKAYESSDVEQMIVIGKGEVSGASIEREGLKGKIIWIPFTKRVRDFYQITDFFIFPTHYEPFGLVILEAAAMGLPLYLSLEFVGASELLENLEEVYLFSTPRDVCLNPIKKLTQDKRMTLRKQREESLKKYTWQRAGLQFEKVLRRIWQEKYR